jgi:hypothetical protein
MLIFCGAQLQLTVDKILLRQDGPLLCTARDATGAGWLILRTDNNPAHLEWTCAPQSERALKAVTANPQTAYDAIRHSATGTAEIITTQHGCPLPDRCILGAHLLPTTASPSYARAA